MADDRALAADWRFDSLVDYYDFNQLRLERLPIRVGKLEERDRSTALATITSTVGQLVTGMPPDVLRRFAVSMIDDLYKTANVLTRWNEVTAQYLGAVYLPVINALATNGYTLHYMADSTFPDGLQRPLIGYPMIFPAAGFVYICPHAIAVDLAKHDSATVPQTVDGLRFYIAEARYLAARLARAATERRRNLVYVEIDFVEGCLDDVMSLGGANGVVGLFRNEAPVAGSNVQVRLP